MDPELPEAARAFVEGDVTLLPSALDDAEIDRLVEYLIAHNDVARLQRLAEAQDRRLAKPARRGIHLLKTRGQSIPKPEKREFRLQGPYAAEEKPPGMVSFYDGHGERVVWLVQPAPESFLVFQVEISQERGLIGFQIGNVPKRDWRLHAEGVIGDRRRMVVRATHAHVRRLIEEAYQRSVAAGRTPPEEFARARLDLGPVEEDPRPEYGPAPEDARSRIFSLHTLPEIALWVPPEETLQQLDLELGQIATSQLVVSPEDRQRQVSAVVDKLLESLSSEFRAQIAERLEETARMLVARDQNEEARLCIYAAQLCRDEPTNPFLRQMFEKLIKPEGEPSGAR